MQLDLRTTRRRRGREVGALRKCSTLSKGSLERGKTIHCKTDRSKESRQQENLVDPGTVEQKELDRIAQEAAEVAEETEEHYDRDHDIFTK